MKMGKDGMYLGSHSLFFISWKTEYFVPLFIASCFDLYNAIARAATPNSPSSIAETAALLSAAPVLLPLLLLLLAAAPAAAAPSVALEPLSSVVSTGAASVVLDEVSM